MIFTTFKEDSAAACHIVQLGYMTGGIVGPAVVEPFIDERLSGIYLQFIGGLQPISNITIDDALHYYPARFVTAYWILSFVGVLTVLLLLAFHFHGKRTNIDLTDYLENKEKLSVRKQLSLSTCSPSHPVHWLHFSLS